MQLISSSEYIYIDNSRLNLQILGAKKEYALAVLGLWRPFQHLGGRFGNDARPWRVTFHFGPVLRNNIFVLNTNRGGLCLNSVFKNTV